MLRSWPSAAGDSGSPACTIAKSVGEARHAVAEPNNGTPHAQDFVLDHRKFERAPTHRHLKVVSRVPAILSARPVACVSGTLSHHCRTATTDPTRLGAHSV